MDRLSRQSLQLRVQNAALQRKQGADTAAPVPGTCFIHHPRNELVIDGGADLLEHTCESGPGVNFPARLSFADGAPETHGLARGIFVACAELRGL
jgi:hypothetical protein